MIPPANLLSRSRRTIAALLLLALAITAGVWMHEALLAVDHAAHGDVVFDPGYQHCERLKVATARAAMDVLGMAGGSPSEIYQADYRRQQMQIQADSEGLDRWAAHDPRHQGLLVEIRASMAALRMALDQATGVSAPLAGSAPVPLLPALNRAQSALSNYSASLTESSNLAAPHYIFAGPMRLWWLLVLILVEIAVLAWLILSIPRSTKRISA